MMRPGIFVSRRRGFGPDPSGGSSYSGWGIHCTAAEAQRNALIHCALLKRCVCLIAASFGAASTVAGAGTFSTGLGNTNLGAVDAAVPGFVGSLGLGKSDAPNVVNPAFVGWATNVVAYQPAVGVGEGWNAPGSALGPVTGNNFDIVSLGDLNSTQIAAHTAPGQITLGFQGGIGNKPGVDFAVFENSLGTQSSVFSEFGYVEVSSDGSHFARFNSISLTPAAVGPYGSVDPTNVKNLAGKHVNAYGNSWGTPFDLSELASDPDVQSGQVKLNGIKYVRIIDIPGDGSSRDADNRPIYDAWTTFDSGGFDLEAIGVLHDWLAGDANLDGVVDSHDLAILASHWQQSGYTFEGGNFDQSGRVDINDLAILARNWQSTSESLGGALTSLGLPGAAVPEPAGLVALLGAGLLLRRRSSKLSVCSSGENAMKIRSLVFASIVSMSAASFGATSTFEDLGLPANSIHNDSSFTTGGAQFNNNFTDFGGGFTGWEGFAYSSKTDSTTPGFGNQYSAIPGHGAGNSATYGMAFVGAFFPPVITLPAGATPVSVDLTNSTYAYLSMRDGDAFAKKFGGVTGNDADFLRLTITGISASNVSVGSIDFYLADYRFANNAQDYLISDWTNVSLASLAGAETLSFSLASSDNGSFGMNTPAYVAIDNLTFVPEPSMLGIFAIAGCIVGRRRKGA